MPCARTRREIVDGLCTWRPRAAIPLGVVLLLTLGSVSAGGAFGVRDQRRARTQIVPTLTGNLTVVVVEEGLPDVTLGGVRVVAVRDRAPSVSQVVTTDGQGQATFQRLTPGRYLVSPEAGEDGSTTVRPPGTATAYGWSGRTFQVRPGNVNPPVELPLPAIAFDLAVRVLAANRTPRVGFTVEAQAFDSGPGLLARSTVDASGVARVRLKCCRIYTVTVPEPWYTPVPELHRVQLELGRRPREILFSVRENRAIVPGVTGRPWRAAARLLRDFGLTMRLEGFGDVLAEPCAGAGVPAGGVYRQLPGESQAAPRDRSVGVRICAPYRANRPVLRDPALEGLPDTVGSDIDPS